MNIAICGDNAIDSMQLLQLLTAAISENDLQAELRSFRGSEALLTAVSAGYSPGVCFLDICMAAVSGHDAAREIKRRQPDCAIIFLCRSADHKAEDSDIGAAHYLLKPVDRAGVAAALHSAAQATGASARFVELIVNRQSRRLLLKDILFAETQAKYCNVYTTGTDEPLRSYLKLDELEALLSHSRFLRCHHSYIVNLDAVAALTEDGCFLLADGAKVPIRQRGRREIQAIYNDYCFKRLKKG